MDVISPANWLCADSDAFQKAQIQEILPALLYFRAVEYLVLQKTP